MNTPVLCLLRKLCHLRRLTLGNVLGRLGKAKIKLGSNFPLTDPFTTREKRGITLRYGHSCFNIVIHTFY